MNEERPRTPQEGEEHSSGKVNKSLPKLKTKKVLLYAIVAIVILTTLILIF